jgi:hypothetical protein
MMVDGGLYGLSILPPFCQSKAMMVDGGLYRLSILPPFCQSKAMVVDCIDCLYSFHRHSVPQSLDFDDGGLLN